MRWSIYKVDGEVIPMVGSYKYLGCAVDEHLHGAKRYGAGLLLG